MSTESWGVGSIKSNASIYVIPFGIHPKERSLQPPVVDLPWQVPALRYDITCRVTPWRDLK
jgi:hypothetical protein